MSDGTLRLTVDISPIHAQDAFVLFGMPDVPMAIARLTQEAAKQSAQDEMINHIGEANEMVDDKQKGGQLARLAGMWCQDINFSDWLKIAGWNDQWDSSPDIAKFCIYRICEVQSRAELDNNPEAAEKFHRLIRIPYMEYLKTL
jgi:hypothetical protein